MHPLALRILEQAVAAPGDRFSPREMAERLGAPLGNVAYHVRRLRSQGLLKASGMEPRRGAVEHYHKITAKAQH